MDTSAQFLLTIGGILLLGLVTSTLARRTFLPRVTLLLIFGTIIGRDVLDLIPVLFNEQFRLIADLTLLMVGFLLGGKLADRRLRNSAGEVIWIALTAAVLTTLTVGTGLYLFGVDPSIAIVLGCIAAATAPAAVLDIVTEAGDKGHFSKLLLSIVALDDVLALILFAVGVSLVKSINGSGGESLFLLVALRELGGALALGALLGLPAAYLTGRVKKGQPILSEALGLVLVCGGLAMLLDVSPLIAAMVMGAIIANRAKHHSYPFHAIEGIEPPLLVIFFVLAGASLEIGALRDIGLIGSVYIVCRTAGKILGARAGAMLSGAEPVVRNWMGPALLPQAGVSIGMALVASEQFPEYRQVLLSVVISSTVLFEIFGPVVTRLAISKSRAHKQ